MSQVMLYLEPFGVGDAQREHVKFVERGDDQGLGHRTMIS
jgi:hypothetical protein